MVLWAHVIKGTFVRSIQISLQPLPGRLPSQTVWMLLRRQVFTQLRADGAAIGGCLCLCLVGSRQFLLFCKVQGSSIAELVFSLPFAAGCMLVAVHPCHTCAQASQLQRARSVSPLSIHTTLSQPHACPG